MKRLLYPILATAFVLLVCCLDACKKHDSPALSTTPATIATVINEEQFFTIPGDAHPAIKRLAETIREQDDSSHFVKELMERSGIPIWDHAKVLQSTSSSEAGPFTVLVPLVPVNTQAVSSFIVATVSDQEVTSLKLINGNHYGAYGFGGTEPLNAELVTRQLMAFDNEIFGTTYFRITDTRLFGLEAIAGDGPHYVAIIPDGFMVPEHPPVIPCNKIVLVDLEGNVTLDTNPLAAGCEEIWVTVTGSSGWGGSTGGSDGGGNNGNGGSDSGSGSSGGDWYNQPCMENPPAVPAPPGYSYPPSCTDFPPFVPLPASNEPTLPPAVQRADEPVTGLTDDDPDLIWWDEDTYDPDIYYAPQSKPTFDNMYQNYPKNASNNDDMPVKDVCTLIGGEILTMYNDGSIENGCALRLSRALNYSGVTIPDMGKQTRKGADGKNYFLTAGQLYNWLEKTLGPADIHLTAVDGAPNGTNFNKKLTGMQNKGIYIMKPISPATFQATGHASLWGGLDCIGRHNYFSAASDVYIWRLN